MFSIRFSEHTSSARFFAGRDTFFDDALALDFSSFPFRSKISHSTFNLVGVSSSDSSQLNVASSGGSMKIFVNSDDERERLLARSNAS